MGVDTRHRSACCSTGSRPAGRPRQLLFGTVRQFNSMRRIVEPTPAIIFARANGILHNLEDASSFSSSVMVEYSPVVPQPQAVVTVLHKVVRQVCDLLSSTEPPPFAKGSPLQSGRRPKTNSTKIPGFEGSQTCQKYARNADFPLERISFHACSTIRDSFKPASTSTKPMKPGT